MAATRRRAYEELRVGIEARGGTIFFQRSGFQWGAWIVGLSGKLGTFPSNGNGFPELDSLYVPKIPHPQHWSDYTRTLVDGAIDRLVSQLKTQYE